MSIMLHQLFVSYDLAYVSWGDMSGQKVSRNLINENKSYYYLFVVSMRMLTVMRYNANYNIILAAFGKEIECGKMTFK